MAAQREILELFGIYKDCAYRKDADRLAAIYDDEVLVFDMWAAFSVSGKAAWKDEIRKWLGSLGDERVVVEFSGIQSALDGSVAFASACAGYAAVAADGKILRSMKNRFTWNLAKKKGQWLIVHQHTSVPIDGKTAQGIFDA